MKQLSLCCLLILLLTSALQAQKRYDQLEYPELNDFQKPEIQTFTADNGVTFFLLEDDELPLIDLSVTIRTGGVQVPNEKAGLAAMTGQVIRSGGTPSHPADSLNALLENRAARIETGIGFSSGSAGMNVLKEDFDELLPVLVDLLMNPAFPEDKIELAKTQQKSSISRRNDNAGPIAAREFDKLIYGDDSKYGRLVEYETVNSVSRDDMVSFHKQNFTGRNMLVGVVGDFDAGTMREKLVQAFGRIPEGTPNTLPFPEVDYDYTSSVNFINKADVNQSTVLLGHIGGMRDNPDYPKVQVMNNVLSGGFSGRLFQKVRTDMGLAYSVGGQYGMSNTFYPGQFYVQVQTKSASTAETIDAIIREIRRLQDEPITEQELQNTKDQFLNSLVFRNASFEQILNRRMSNEYRGLAEDAFDEFIAGVRATTVKDVQQMAREYLHPDDLQILVVGNREEIGDQLQKYGTVNEIDIRIPRPGTESTETVQGDPQKGAELLNEMAEAVIHPGTGLNSLSVTGEVVQGGQTIGTSMTIHYPDAIEQTIEAPMGQVQLSYKGGSGTMTMGGQQRPLPPQMANGLKSTLNRSFMAIAMSHEELNPQFLGTEEVDGQSYRKVSVQVDGTPVTLLLDPETKLPRIQRYQQFNPQQGQQVTIENHYSDWQTVDGVRYPYHQVTFMNGTQSAEASYESHAVNE
ncbi:M16 family metallopeptidase [Fodinibius sediminis]|uniref:Predicted Zn-dependent peptidase n=1 Tax=Fodinibius sediminis TaxID=1214077 RepID=A0A521BWD3_9BACT|nr:pitrilysin family protein [Fodinibius sediminis]SMO51478.1 Predicted Zn-dependent peptidase [Fodinibius sediminis]